MAKYKVGDRVRVRSDLNVNKVYSMYHDIEMWKSVNDTMIEFSGKVVTIIYSCEIYSILEDGNKWYWTDEMFEGLAGETLDVERKETKMTNLKSYKIFNDTAVVVEFADGDVQKAVCMADDQFDLEFGVSLCAIKHALGGDDKYKALIKSALRDVKEIDKETKRQEEEAELIARKKAKAARRKAQKLARKKEERIEEQKEAYLRAMREVGKIK